VNIGRTMSEDQVVNHSGKFKPTQLIRRVSSCKRFNVLMRQGLPHQRNPTLLLPRPFSPRPLHDRSARFHLKFDATVALMMEMGRAEDQDAKGVEGLLTNPIM
jgi:hypothetical protein